MHEWWILPEKQYEYVGLFTFARNSLSLSGFLEAPYSLEYHADHVRREQLVRHLNIQTGTMLSQPIFSLPIIWHHLIYFIPEGIIMIFLVNVTQLVYHDVVDNFGRRHHALPVKIKHPALATAGPAVTHIFYF